MKDLAATQECNQTGWACKHREMSDEVKSLNHFKGYLWGRVPDVWSWILGSEIQIETNIMNRY